MSVLRFTISALAVIGLAAGYGASLIAFFTGRAARYADAVDGPAVRYAALALLLAALILAAVPRREEEP
jgi:hypothetical protein